MRGDLERTPLNHQKISFSSFFDGFWAVFYIRKSFGRPFVRQKKKKISFGCLEECVPNHTATCQVPTRNIGRRVANFRKQRCYVRNGANFRPDCGLAQAVVSVPCIRFLHRRDV